MAADENLPELESGLAEVIFWHDQASSEMANGQPCQDSLEIMLAKLANHMAQTGQLEYEPRYGSFEE